jgi:hypothetical protein
MCPLSASIAQAQPAGSCAAVTADCVTPGCVPAAAAPPDSCKRVYVVYVRSYNAISTMLLMPRGDTKEAVGSAVMCTVKSVFKRYDYTLGGKMAEYNLATVYTMPIMKG